MNNFKTKSFLTAQRKVGKGERKGWKMEVVLRRNRWRNILYLISLIGSRSEMMLSWKSQHGLRKASRNHVCEQFAVAWSRNAAKAHLKWTEGEWKPFWSNGNLIWTQSSSRLKMKITIDVQIKSLPLWCMEGGDSVLVKLAASTSGKNPSLLKGIYRWAAENGWGNLLSSRWRLFLGRSCEFSKLILNHAKGWSRTTHETSAC